MLGRDQRCAALCGLWQDNNPAEQSQNVAIKIKNTPLFWYKQSNIYEIFHEKYVVFNY